MVLTTGKGFLKYCKDYKKERKLRHYKMLSKSELVKKAAERWTTFDTKKRQRYCWLAIRERNEQAKTMVKPRIQRLGRLGGKKSKAGNQGNACRHKALSVTKRRAINKSYRQHRPIRRRMTPSRSRSRSRTTLGSTTYTASEHLSGQEGFSTTGEYTAPTSQTSQTSLTSHITGLSDDLHSTSDTTSSKIYHDILPYRECTPNAKPSQAKVKRVQVMRKTTHTASSKTRPTATRSNITRFSARRPTATRPTATRPMPTRSTITRSSARRCETETTKEVATKISPAPETRRESIDTKRDDDDVQTWKEAIDHEKSDDVKPEKRCVEKTAAFSRPRRSLVTCINTA